MTGLAGLWFVDVVASNRREDSQGQNSIYLIYNNTDSVPIKTLYSHLTQKFWAVLQKSLQNTQHLLY